MCHINIIQPSDCDEHPAKVWTKCSGAAEEPRRWCDPEKKRYLKAQDGFSIPCLWCAIHRGIGEDMVLDDRYYCDSTEDSDNATTSEPGESKDRQPSYRPERPGEAAIREAREDAVAARRRSSDKRRSARREESRADFRSEGERSDYRSTRSRHSSVERGSPSRRNSKRDTWPPHSKPRKHRKSYMPDMARMVQMPRTPSAGSMPRVTRIPPMSPMPPLSPMLSMPYRPQMPYTSPVIGAPGSPQVSYPPPYTTCTPRIGTPTYDCPPGYPPHYYSLNPNYYSYWSPYPQPPPPPPPPPTQ